MDRMYHDRGSTFLSGINPRYIPERSNPELILGAKRLNEVWALKQWGNLWGNNPRERERISSWMRSLLFTGAHDTKQLPYFVQQLVAFKNFSFCIFFLRLQIDMD